MKEKEWNKKIPTHPGFPIFVPTYTEDVMKNILDLQPFEIPYIILCVYVREKWLFLVCVWGEETCGSIADRPQGRCAAALNRTSHDMYNDDTFSCKKKKKNQVAAALQLGGVVKKKDTQLIWWCNVVPIWQLPPLRVGPLFFPKHLRTGQIAVRLVTVVLEKMKRIATAPKFFCYK